MARYQVGQKVPVIQINFEMKSPRFLNLYLPWEDTLTSINVKVLECVSHQRVPGDWDNEVKYDGYIFNDPATSVEYYNQYPRASYGQISTDNDWRFYDNSSKEDYFNPYTDASNFLSKIEKGIRDLRETKPEWSEMLKEHYDQVVKLVEAEGFNVKVEPFRYTKKDGTEHVSTVKHVVVTPK